jgi:hypothetical protein
VCLLLAIKAAPQAALGRRPGRAGFHGWDVAMLEQIERATEVDADVIGDRLSAVENKAVRGASVRTFTYAKQRQPSAFPLAQVQTSLAALGDFFRQWVRRNKRPPGPNLLRHLETDGEESS